MLKHDDALSIIQGNKLIAIMRGMPFEKIEKVLEALIGGGVRAVEFTFDHGKEGYIEATCEKIAFATEKYGDSIAVGCGTALSIDELKSAHDAGACIAISPNVNPEVIKTARDLGMVSLPGAFTPTEIVSAYEAGADIVKLFPASCMDKKYIAAIRAPLKHIPMCMVGGVMPEDVETYLKFGICAFGVGSPLFAPDLVEEDQYELIKMRAELYTNAIKGYLCQYT